MARSDSGIRVFKESDYDWLIVIDCLKKTGLSIKEIRTVIEWTMEGDSTIDKRLALFKKQKNIVQQQLADIQNVLEILELNVGIMKRLKKREAQAFLKTLPKKICPNILGLSKINSIQCATGDNGWSLSCVY